MRKIKKTPAKKQFRLYDVYRYVVTGDMSDIDGIVSYDVNKDASIVVIRYVDYSGVYQEGIPCNYFSRNEKELKEVIRLINKRLNNCLTPGPKRSRTKWTEAYDGKL